MILLFIITHIFIHKKSAFLSYDLFIHEVLSSYWMREEKLIGRDLVSIFIQKADFLNRPVENQVDNDVSLLQKI